MANAPAPTQVTWQSLRVLGYSLVAAPLVILVAMYSILGSEEHAFSPPLWALLAPIALAFGSATLVGAIGYRTEAMAPGTPREDLASLALPRFQSLMILRMAFTEVVAIISIALAFVVPQGGFAVILLGVVLAEALMWWHVVPSQSQVRRVQQSLEARGAQVPLWDILHGR
jgi:hypothetical protein